MTQSPTMTAQTEFTRRSGPTRPTRPGSDHGFGPRASPYFAAGLAGFLFLGLPWWAFLLLLIVPDVSMVGYLRGPRVGAIVYNVAHDLATGVGHRGRGPGDRERARGRDRSHPRRPQRDGPDDGLRPEAPEFIQGHAPRPDRARPLTNGGWGRRAPPPAQGMGPSQGSTYHASGSGNLRHESPSPVAYQSGAEGRNRRRDSGTATRLTTVRSR